MCQELFGNPFLFWDCRNDTRVIGLKPINCELSNWHCSFGFLFFSVLNIEIWKLKFTLLMLMTHFGCVFSLMYWFLIKAWCYYNRHFVFSLIKQFLSLVWKWFGLSWRSRKMVNRQHRGVISMLIVEEGGVPISQSALPLPCTSSTIQSWETGACSGIDFVAHVFPSPSLELARDCSVLCFSDRF